MIRMLDRLLQALVSSPNEAADDLLLEALSVGSESEQGPVLEALFKRQTTHGLSGVIGAYEALSDRLKLRVLGNIKKLHPALRECGRSDDMGRRKGALSSSRWAGRGSWRTCCRKTSTTRMKSCPR